MILDYVATHLITHLVAKTLISPFTTLGRVVIVVVLVPVVVVLVVEARNTSVPIAIPIAILKGWMLVAPTHLKKKSDGSSFLDELSE